MVKPEYRVPRIENDLLRAFTGHVGKSGSHVYIERARPRVETIVNRQVTRRGTLRKKASINVVPYHYQDGKDFILSPKLKKPRIILPRRPLG